jgi:hypothetical protein
MRRLLFSTNSTSIDQKSGVVVYIFPSLDFRRDDDNDGTAGQQEMHAHNGR